MTKEEWNQVCLDYYNSLEEDIEELAEELIYTIQFTEEELNQVSGDLYY